MTVTRLREDQLHPYQRKCVEMVLDKTHAGLFLEMGLGKTVSTLTAINELMYREGAIGRVLIIAPKRVAESVWDAEINKWEHLKHFKIVKIAGTEKQRRKALATNADIYTIGRDNVQWLCALYGGGMLPFEMLVIDELSSFKNPSSKRFKALKNVQPSFRRVVGLTGTPAPNSVADLWSQLYLLDRGARLGKTITAFREAYCRMEHVTNVLRKPVVTEYGKEVIYSKISDICISMKAADYLDLPGRIDNIISINMPASLQDKYEEFEREMVLDYLASLQPGEPITAANAAGLANKLLQFANGAIYDANRHVHEVHTLKIDELKEILEDANGKPVLCAWTFQHDRDRIFKYLTKYKPRELKTQQDIDDWNDGKVQLLTMHPASGGHGLNLQAGGHIIVWFGQTWSLELEQQFNARLDRQGQKQTVIIHKLTVAGTMDERVIDTQNGKAREQNGLMEAVKAVISKYGKAN